MGGNWGKLSVKSIVTNQEVVWKDFSKEFENAEKHRLKRRGFCLLNVSGLSF